MSHRPAQSWWNTSRDDTPPSGLASQLSSSSTQTSGGSDSEQTLAPSLTAYDHHYARQTDVPKRIHLIGVGSIGKLVAYALRSLRNPPPVTLMLHRPESLKQWRQSNSRITVKSGNSEASQTGFDIEVLPSSGRQHSIQVEPGQPDVYTAAEELHMRPHELARMLSGQPTPESKGSDTEKSHNGDTKPLPRQDTLQTANSDPIDTLIVATKTIHTRAALTPLRHRLSRNSTICFLQNGMGIIDEINTHLFPRESERPLYVQGIITHGAHSPPQLAERDPFYVVHAGHGTIALGAINDGRLASPKKGNLDGNSPRSAETQPRANSPKNDFSGTARYLLRTLTRSPILSAVGFAPLELQQQQLEKLAVNSIINPLTVLLDNRNGSILYNFSLTRMMRLMLAEISLVIRSLPELQGIPNVAQRFSAARLETLVVSVADKTRDNISSMLADARRGSPTEIEYINGYIVTRGEELGIKCVINYAVMQMVIAKSAMIQRELKDNVPVARIKL